MELSYRNLVRSDLTAFRVRIETSDLLILADRDLSKEASDYLLKIRESIKLYANENPIFLKSFVPISYDEGAPDIVKRMIEVAYLAGVGPMASVAGAIAEFVGSYLLNYSREVIVENGGDIFLDTSKERVVAIYAGNSPISGRIGLKLPPGRYGIATSSATIGHSVNLGIVDSATVISNSSALSDAFATALGNMVRHPVDIRNALKWLSSHKELGITGGVIVVGKNIGIWGDVEVVKL
ncbi:MAG: UPF0280 family protein [Thermosulfidibacteraceae bacterium]|jgi:ApbE superfamily uncharacterized protein (UPF0280 family)